jgi:mono/diheme cytochrome c family protein
MLRKIGKVVVRGLALVALALVALVARAEWVVERSYADVPEPPIVADRSAEGVARGEMLFHSICLECHGGPDGRATGKRLDEVPAFLGTMWSANLAHPERGVAKLTDGQIARTLRTGVLHDGRLSPAMNGFGYVGDRDVAAILGYLRSGPSVLAPGGDEQPRSRITLTGALIVTYVARITPSAPASVPAPPKAPTPEYGRYMAQVLDCVGCHTEGFGSDKLHDPKAFAGGFELTDPTGTPIWTRNITPDDETGIGRWSRDDFARAVTRGVSPDGRLVRKPMPLFARLDATDVDALYAFLRSVPRVHHPNRPGGAPVERPRKDDPPEALFTKLGCAACHGESAPYRTKLAGAIDKSDDEVASWILDPQATRPGSPMPSFGSVIDRDQALGLARHARSLAVARGAEAAR